MIIKKLWITILVGTLAACSSGKNTLPALKGTKREPINTTVYDTAPLIVTSIPDAVNPKLVQPAPTKERPSQSKRRYKYRKTTTMNVSEPETSIAETAELSEPIKKYSQNKELDLSGKSVALIEDTAKKNSTENSTETLSDHSAPKVIVEDTAQSTEQNSNVIALKPQTNLEHSAPIVLERIDNAKAVDVKQASNGKAVPEL